MFLKHFKLYALIVLLLTAGNTVFISAESVKMLTEPFDSISQEFDRIYLMHGNQAKELVAELYHIAHSQPDSLPFICECLHKEALLSFDQGIVDITIPERIRLRLADEAIAPYYRALMEYSLGMYLSATGNYSEAFTVTLQALTGFRNQNNRLFIGKSLNIIGTVCSHINLIGMSDSYYKEALEYSQPDERDYLRIKNNIARLNLFRENEQTAADSLMAIIPAAELLADTGIVAIICLNLGSSFFSLREYDTAYLYWQKAAEIIKMSDNLRIEATLNQNMGAYYVLAEKNYGKALECFRLTMQIAKESNNLVQLSASYRVLYQTFELTEQPDSAYLYLKKHLQLVQQLVPNAKAIEAYQSYVSTFLEASENRLTIARQEIKLKERRNIVMVMLLVSIVLVATIFLLLFQQQKRKKERENHRLEERLKHEKEIQEIEKNRQEEVIAAQTREITSYSLLLLNKNNVFNQISELNNQLTGDSKQTKEISSKIGEIIKNNRNTESEWKTFKIHFEKVHPRFFDKLKQHSSELTENNLRICAYFRIGMTTKQVAQILNISPGSVFLHRHRLKQKLRLNETDDLDNFIRMI
ncbi:MAG: LuxR C-terminal-related transcriptional regulator [Cytophagaceae bacterium]|jgi:DNA-binding CsgD family transcriptional regulator|nr:LuxR C-terminal-related transcriptional regulator [Cytophagaceae bacterium]